MNRLRAAWRAFRYPEAEYWRGFRAARDPFLHVLRRMRNKHAATITFDLHTLLTMLFPDKEHRTAILEALDATDNPR